MVSEFSTSIYPMGSVPTVLHTKYCYIITRIMATGTLRCGKHYSHIYLADLHIIITFLCVVELIQKHTGGLSSRSRSNSDSDSVFMPNWFSHSGLSS